MSMEEQWGRQTKMEKFVESEGTAQSNRAFSLLRIGDI